MRKKLKPAYYIDKLSILAPKALCIVSKYSFIDQYREILKQLYRLHLSHCTMPIERYVCNFTDEIPIPAKGETLVQYEIGTSLVSFYRPLDQIPPYASVTLGFSCVERRLRILVPITKYRECDRCDFSFAFGEASGSSIVSPSSALPRCLCAH